MSKKINLIKVHKIANNRRLTAKQTQILIEKLKNPEVSGYKLALKAGYSESVARHNPVANVPKIKQSIADYIREGNYDSKIQRHYDEALALSTDEASNLGEKLDIVKAKQQVMKQLHKIAGHEAPVKRDIRTISFNVPNFDEDEQ